MIFKCAVIFICAILLLLTVETSGEKFCRVRNYDLYPREIWDYYTGFFCYTYTNDIRLECKLNYTAVSRNNFTVPGFHKLSLGTCGKMILPDNETFTFSYKDIDALQYIYQSFKTDHFYKMWIHCCEEAAKCCDDHMDDTNIYPSDEYPCPAVWDAWTCYAPAKKGTIVKTKCSEQAYSTETDVCELLSEKECFPSGTWNVTTNYAVCAMAPVLRSRHTFNVISLAVSSILSLPAVIIFFSLRTFRRNLRYILHRNLILIIIVRSLLTIMSKEIIIMDALKEEKQSNHVMDNNSIACRVLAFFESVAKNGMYACMLADGFYLHKLIVRAFASDPNMNYIYLAITILSFLPSLIWAVVRDVHQGTDCWMVDESNDQWIIDGFRIAILVINFLLLLDIIRVMVMKLRRQTISQQIKSTLRATAFLIPLFGLQIVFITNRSIVPPGSTCADEDIYYYISYTIEGLQGVMVALLFCYLSAEVQKEMKNVYRKFVLNLESRFDISLYDKTETKRRSTAATFVDPH